MAISYIQPQGGLEGASLGIVKKGAKPKAEPGL